MTTDDKRQIRFTMRIDADIYEVVKKNALNNKRSTAKEIEYRLEQSLKTIR